MWLTLLVDALNHSQQVLSILKRIFNPESNLKHITKLDRTTKIALDEVVTAVQRLRALSMCLAEWGDELIAVAGLDCEYLPVWNLNKMWEHPQGHPPQPTPWL